MDLEALRRRMDEIDAELLRLFAQRMRVAAQIGQYKQRHRLPITDAAREQDKLRDVTAKLPEDLQAYGCALYEELFALSRDYQSRRTGKRCGLLGRTLGHSYSPQIHAQWGGYAYRLYEKEPEELGDFLQSGDFDGLNVTVPYKKAVIPYCAELSDTAKAIGSVNSLIRRGDGSLYGDNTDAFGLESLMSQAGMAVCGKKALVLGSGGTSATACAVLKKLGAAEITVISRRGGNNYENLDRHGDAHIIINTTPVGMYPHNGEQAVDLRLFPHCCGVVDVIYNPARTALLLQAEALGIPHENGLSMLAAQAKRASELFTGKSLPDEDVERSIRAVEHTLQNIVLIGMPGCGKSTLARLLGERLNRPVVELDRLIEETAGLSIPEIFAAQGESGFRVL